jgi:hypothetical protein
MLTRRAAASPVAEEGSRGGRVFVFRGGGGEAGDVKETVPAASAAGEESRVVVGSVEGDSEGISAVEGGSEGIGAGGPCMAGVGPGWVGNGK